MSDLQAAKDAVRAMWAAVDGGKPGAVADFVSDDFLWQGFAPLPEIRGADAYVATVLAPFRQAFPDYERQVHIFLAGASNGRRDGQGDGAIWVGATGYYVGTPVTDVWGIPAHRGRKRLRWAEFWRFEDGALAQCQCLIDLIDWFEQMGRSVLPPPTGVPHVWPAPTGYDGCLMGVQDEAEAARSMALGRGLIFDGLNAFDQSDLSSMGMAGFFHPNIKWYGPGGIGACLSLQEFEDLHQKPWLVAFPDRAVQDLDNLIAEDRLVGGSSLPGVVGHHSGSYQGVAGTGAEVRINGIDFWLRTGDQFVENWVYVDFVHLFAQMGVDLMDQMRKAA